MKLCLKYSRLFFCPDTVCISVCVCGLYNRILICPVVEEDRSAKKLSIKVDAKVSCMKYLDGRMYVGLKTGTLLIYSRDKGLYLLLLLLLLLLGLVMLWLWRRVRLLTGSLPGSLGQLSLPSLRGRYDRALAYWLGLRRASSLVSGGR